jgi:hypothetical protein
MKFMLIFRLSSDFNMTNVVKVEAYKEKHNGSAEFFIYSKGFNLKFTEVFRDQKTHSIFDIFNDAVTNNGFYGLPIAIHGPNEIISNEAFRFSTNQINDLKVLITPVVIGIDDSLRVLDVER